MSECVYCTLPEIQERATVREDLAWAFPTNIPITPGHTLVCPVRCVRTVDGLTQEERDAIENMRQRIVQAIKKQFNAEGFHFAWNEGETAGQSIPHLHLHIVPRKKGDDGITEYEPRKFLHRPGSRIKTREEELREIAGFIRNAL